MNDDPSRPDGDTWVYESIVGAIPGLAVSPRRSVLVQFIGFEVALLVLATWYELWTAVPAGTVAIAVAASGSAFMHDIGDRVRRIPTPEAYERLLFGSSIEVVLGVFAYTALLTYLFVLDPRAAPSLLHELLGSTPPAPAVFLLLVILWDLTYRIGTGWWAAIVSLWRSLRFEQTASTAAPLRTVDWRILAFGTVQLGLIPFLIDHITLAVAVAGHVLAVWLVVGAARVLSR